jgi:hypothetical protein
MTILFSHFSLQVKKLIPPFFIIFDDMENHLSYIVAILSTASVAFLFYNEYSKEHNEDTGFTGTGKKIKNIGTMVLFLLGTIILLVNYILSLLSVSN